MNTKLMLLGLYFLIFSLAKLVSTRLAYANIQDMGQIFGLGGVAVGYFVAKIFKKK
jgi:hypothetical protein